MAVQETGTTPKIPLQQKYGNTYQLQEEEMVLKLELIWPHTVTGVHFTAANHHKALMMNYPTTPKIRMAQRRARTSAKAQRSL